MGAFASAIGGAGQAAQQYSQQMRAILENHKYALADHISQILPQLTDPETKSGMAGLIGDVYGGKDMGPIVKQFGILLQKHQQREQAFQSAIAKPDAQVNTAKASGPAGPGQVPGGTFTGLLTPPPDAVGAEAIGSAPAGASGGTPMNVPLSAPFSWGQAQSFAPASAPAAPIAAQTTQTAVPIGETKPIQAQTTSTGTAITAPQPAPSPAASNAPSVSGNSPYDKFLQNGVISPAEKWMLDREDEFIRDGRFAPPASMTTYTAPIRQKMAQLSQEEALLNYRMEKAKEIMGGDLSRPPTLSEIMQMGIAGIQVPAGILNAGTNPLIYRNLSASDIRRQYPGRFDKELEGVGDNAPVDLEFNKLDRSHPIAVHVTSENNRLLGYDADMNPIYGGSRSLQPSPALPGIHSLSSLRPVDTGLSPSGQHEYVPAGQLNRGTAQFPVLGPGRALSFFPTQTSHTGVEFKDINGQITPVTVNSGTTSRRGSQGDIPSATPQAPSPAPSGPSRHPGSGFRVGDPIGPSQGTYNKEVENPLTEKGQEIVQNGSTVMKQVDQALSMLEDKKDDNSPIPLGVSRILYGLGISDNNSQLINSIELQRLLEGGVLLKQTGGSRAMSVLEQALTHTPGTLNSYKLMYEKLKNIKQNIQGGIDAAKQYMQKNPGLNNKTREPISPPPGGTRSPSVSPSQSGWKVVEVK